MNKWLSVSNISHCKGEKKDSEKRQVYRRALKISWEVAKGTCCGRSHVSDMIRYDTVDLRALKSWRDGSLILRTAQKRKNKNKNQVAQKKLSRQ